MKRFAWTAALLVFAVIPLIAGGNAEDSGKTKITLIHYMGEQQKRDGLQAWIDSYAEIAPDVEFEVTAVEYSNYLTTLKTMIAAGDIPDIMFGKPKEHTDLIEAGHLADMTGAPFLDNLAPGAVPSVVYKGKVYGVPIDLQTLVVFYNKDVFAAQGLSVPTTWSEFIADCDALEAAGIAPFAHPFKDSWTVFVDYFADEYVVRQEAPNFYTEIEAGRKSFADYPHFRKLLERLHKRASYEAGDDWGTDNATAQNMMATGKAAMYIMGSWSVGDFIRDFPDVPIGIFGLPSYEDPAKNMLAIGVDDCWMASAASDNGDAVLDFFSHITSPESAVAWMDATKTISYSQNIADYDYDPITQEIMDILATGDTTNFHEPQLFSSALEDVYRNMIVEAVASGSDDYDALIAEFDKRIDEVR